MGVGATLRVLVPDQWPPLWPTDVTVEVGEEYEAIVVEAAWVPSRDGDDTDYAAAADAGMQLPPLPTLAAEAVGGDVEVRLTPPTAPTAWKAEGSGSPNPSLAHAYAYSAHAGRAAVRCLIPPRFCGVDVVSGGGAVTLESVTESHVAIDSGGGDVTLGSVKGAKLRIATGGGALHAKNLTADSDISTDGGNVTLGKLVGRVINLHTLGGDVSVGALFADTITLDTAGGGIHLKAAQVSGSGVFRSHGGGVSIQGLAGDGEVGEGALHRYSPPFS